MESKVYTSQEVCDILKCSRHTIEKLVKDGRLIRVLPGRYSVASVTALLEGGTSDLSNQQQAEASTDQVNSRDGSQSLSSFVQNEWWPTCQRKKLAATTLSDYKITVDKYLLPDWGDYTLDAITVPLVIEIWNVTSEKHTEAMAHRVLAKLSMILESARRRRYVSYNAVQDAWYELPTLKREERIPLTPKQTMHLFAVVEGDKMCLFYHVALTFGFRLGELLGLQWDDINWEARTITVQRQVQEVAGQKHVKQGAKTEAGNRTVPIPPRLYQRFRQAWNNRGSSAFIFCTKDGKSLTPSVVSHHWRGGRTGKKKRDGTDVILKGMRQKAELPEYVTIHNFRHTVATRLMELRIPDEIRDAIMGHGKKGIRGHYAHATLDAMRRALEEFENSMWDNHVAH